MCDKRKFKDILIKFLDENNITHSKFDKILIKYNNDNFRIEDIDRNVDITYHDILVCVHTMEEFNPTSLLITHMVKLLYATIDEKIQELKDIQTFFKHEYLGKNYDSNEDIEIT
ncbi:unnamed protein product [Commensalibacter communis]|uniref:Uncharacterized protein n=2 Tax=Commensalibacter communis TaxID=2972786 RepID=A0A9W4XDI1_9PROT|nr:unnamed protein product [Commensalibacter communis]CAI3947610.1 unnamed protein product [Commensalibacter communis]CAI3953441.1 unnamed protein product [Commensalibacter communis]